MFKTDQKNANQLGILKFDWNFFQLHFDSRRQPRAQALSTTRLAGGKTLVQAGHVSPRFWEITTGTYGG